MVASLPERSAMLVAGVVGQRVVFLQGHHERGDVEHPGDERTLAVVKLGEARVTD